jgi:hypothetical protein
VIEPATGRRGARGVGKSSLALALGPTIVRWAIVLTVLWGTSGSAQVDEPPNSPARAADAAAVEITVVGGPRDLQRVRSVVGPRAIAGSAPRWTSVARFDPMEILEALRDSPSTVVHGWVDISDPGRARLYFAARSGQRFLVRDVELSRNFDEVDRESLASVVELSITALLENERASLTRAQVQQVLAAREQAQREQAAREQAAREQAAREQAAREQAAREQAQREQAAREQATREPRRDTPPPLQSGVIALQPPTVATRGAGPAGPAFRVDVGVFYGANAPGGGLPVAHGPGLDLALAGRAEDRWSSGVWLSGQYLWASQFAGASVGVELQSIALRGGLELLLPVLACRMSARLGVGADAVYLSPRPGSIDPNAMLTPARWSESLALTVALGIRRNLGSRFALGGAIFADVLPTAVHYDQSAAGMSSEVISPRRIRPGLLLEIAVH